MNRRSVIAALLASVALSAGIGKATAQDGYPSRVIKFIVPFAAGSATDTLARVLGQSMSASLGQSVVVDNMPGANGFLAAQNVARAEPDGYTVLITSNTTHAANQSLFKKLPYDPVADFAPVTKLGTITLALVTNPSVPAATAQELIAYAKANPGDLTFGSGRARPGWLARCSNPWPRSTSCTCRTKATRKPSRICLAGRSPWSSPISRRRSRKPGPAS